MVNCAICKQPMEVEIEEDSEITALLLKKFAKKLVHGSCAARLGDINRSENRDALEDQRRREFAKMCPPLYWETDLRRLQQEGRQNALEWKFEACGLLLHGPPRTGKTRTAWKILEREFMAGRSIRYFTAPGLNLELRSRQMDARGYKRLLDELRQVDILFVDDLGKARWSEYTEEMFFEIIEARTSHHRPCIFTTNDSSAEMQRRMHSDGLAILSRLQEFCYAVEFGGEPNQ